MIERLEKRPPCARPETQSARNGPRHGDEQRRGKKSGGDDDDDDAEEERCVNRSI